MHVYCVFFLFACAPTRINIRNSNERRAGATVETRRQGLLTNPPFPKVSMEERVKEKHLLHANTVKNAIKARVSGSHPKTYIFNG